MLYYSRRLYSWIKSTKKFDNFLANNLKTTNFSTQASPPVGVLITPWEWTTVPFYSYAMGLLIAKDHKVVFIIDDIVRTHDLFGYWVQRTSIKFMLRHLKKHFEVICLSNIQSNSKQIDSLLIEKMSEANTIHQLKGENVVKGRKSYHALMSKLLSTSYGKVEKVLSERKWKYVLVPGGLKFTTGLFSEIGAKQGTRVASYDSDDQIVLLSIDGVCSQLPDIPKTFELIKQNPKLYEKIRTETFNELEKRRSGESIIHYLKGTNDIHAVDYKDCILLVLNACWDSAALNRYVVFKNQSDWIIETVRWVIKNTDKKIVIRQHPVEKYDFASTTDNYQQLIDENIFEGKERVHVIDCYSKINTYSLLPFAKCCIVHTSTMGLEAIIQNTPVITPSIPYYAGLNICNTALTRVEYFSLIEKSLNDKLPVSKENIDNSILCYYITQLCNYSTTDFNPCASFNTWTDATIENIQSRNSVKQILNSFNNSIPYSYLVATSKEQSNG